MSNTLLLALDTSTEYCSVALAVFPSRAFFSGLPGVTSPFRVFGLANLFIRHENTDIVSSERLLPMVREVFDEARRDLSDCAAIALALDLARSRAYARLRAQRKDSLLHCRFRRYQSIRYWRARRPRTCIVQPQRACSPRLTRGWTKSIGACLNGKKRAPIGVLCKRLRWSRLNRQGQRAFSRLRAMRPQYLARGWRRERVPHRLTRARCRTQPRSPVWVGNACAQDMPYRRWMRSRNMYATALRSRPWNASQNFD